MLTPQSETKSPVIWIFGGAVFLSLIALIPFGEIVLRLFNRSLPGSAPFIRYSVLGVVFSSAVIASARGTHLNLGLFQGKSGSFWNKGVLFFTTLFGSSLAAAFGLSAFSYILTAFDPSDKIGGVPLQAALLILPVAYFSMGAYALKNTAELSGRSRKQLLLLTILFGFLLGIPPLFNTIDTLTGFWPDAFTFILDHYHVLLSVLRLPLILLLVLAGFLGLPIFYILGGTALILFAASSGSLESLPNEAYTLLTDDFVAAIPLFTFVGFLLSESRSGERMVAFFQELCGIFPGGLAVVTLLVCSFFTTFNGASGVTILAMGGVLYYILRKNGEYDQSFSTGLLTLSGSLGLLFPPSLPIIMYSIIAKVNLRDMFIAGFIPGGLSIAVLSLYGAFHARKMRKKGPYNGPDRSEYIREVLLRFVLPLALQFFSFFLFFRFFRAQSFVLILSAGVLYYFLMEKFFPTKIWGFFKKAFGELLTPLILLGSLFSGLTTLSETAAVTVVYILILEVGIHRDISFRQIPHLFRQSLPIIGGVLTILIMAKGLSYYIVDIDVPNLLRDWIGSHIRSRAVFLILLNLILLLAGCLMDIFSAILVIVPLIVPMAEIYDIRPIHLGIIFLTNLQLGYLTPPVGLNLFLSSYRFKKPLPEIYRSVVPFLLISFGIVLLVTYFPPLSLGLLRLFKASSI